jgi:hypothetical protein
MCERKSPWRESGGHEGPEEMVAGNSRCWFAMSGFSIICMRIILYSSKVSRGLRYNTGIGWQIHPRWSAMTHPRPMSCSHRYPGAFGTDCEATMTQGVLATA